MEPATPLAVLKNRTFRIYWIGQAISLVGTWMQTMAQQWVVAGLSDSATVLGALVVVGNLPIVALSLKGGSLADRFEKRRILLRTQVAMMLLAFAFAALAFTGQIALWHVFVLAFLLGIATAFDLPAAQSFAPELVAPAQIPKAVALMQTIFHGSRLIGPALAGLLVDNFGEGSAFLANGLSFVAVIYSLVLIKPAAGADPPAARPKGNIREGFAYVRSERWVMALILLTALTTSLIFPFVVVLMVYYVRHVLAADAQGMGIMLSASGLGSLLGVLLLLVGGPKTRLWRLFAGVLGSALALLGLSFTRGLYAALPLYLALAFSVSSLMGTISQAVQEYVPGALRGRVMSIYSIAFSGLMPFAGLLLSRLVDQAGLPLIMRVCGGLYAGLALLVLSTAAPALAKIAAPRGPGD
jgi:MFS family permease